MKEITPSYLAALVLADNNCTMREAVQAISVFLVQIRESAQPPAGLRDEFAMRAAPIMYGHAVAALQRRAPPDGAQVNLYEIAALSAYELTDAMLEARKPKPALAIDYALAVRAGYGAYARQTHVGAAWDITWPGKTGMDNSMYKTEREAQTAAVTRFTAELTRARELLALVA